MSKGNQTDYNWILVLLDEYSRGLANETTIDVLRMEGFIDE